VLSLLGRTAEAAAEAASATTLANEKEENMIKIYEMNESDVCTMTMYKTEDVKRERCVSRCEGSDT
jgi:hypothetical protein